MVVVDGGALNGADFGCVVMLEVESSGGGDELVMAVLVAFTKSERWLASHKCRSIGLVICVGCGRYMTRLV